jgi:membrane-associated protease RseP (regulator of RpoE activity)
MNSHRTWNLSAFALATIAIVAFVASPVWAKGGGHGGGGHHGGGHRGHANHHPYHPSHHHAEHHAHHHSDHHEHHAHHDHHDHHHNHHHSSWHRGNWGPGFWGGAALGAGLGYAWAPWGYGDYGYGGDTYVDNSTNVTPAYNPNDDSSADDSGNDQPSAPNSTANNGFATDDWPELGITTYAGQYGGSQGQVIVRIVPNSAAAKVGLVPGDVILSLNGQPTPSADALDQLLDSANGQFTAQVWDARTGRTSTVSGQLDANAPAPPTPPAPQKTTATVSQQ